MSYPPRLHPLPLASVSHSLSLSPLAPRSFTSNKVPADRDPPHSLGNHPDGLNPCYSPTSMDVESTVIQEMPIITITVLSHTTCFNTKTPPNVIILSALRCVTTPALLASTILDRIEGPQWRGDSIWQATIPPTFTSGSRARASLGHLQHGLAWAHKCQFLLWGGKAASSETGRNLAFICTLLVEVYEPCNGGCSPARHRRGSQLSLRYGFTVKEDTFWDRRHEFVTACNVNLS